MKSLPNRPNHSRSRSCTAGYGLTAALLVVLASGSLTGCIQEAATSSPERTVLLLLELLQDAQPEIRRTAAESIGKIGDPTTVASLIPLMTDRTPLVREAAVWAIGRVHPVATSEITALCISALGDSFESVRRAAAIALGELEPPAELMAAVPALLSSGDVGVKKAAVQALLQVDSTSWLPQIIAALHDADPEVRQGLTAALGEWGGSMAGPWLKARLAEDLSPAVRVEAVYRLGKISGNEMKAVLEAVLERDADQDVRRWARQARE